MLAVVASAADLPDWIKSGPTSNRDSYFVTCSADALDPQEAEQLAQNRCIADAAKLSGVKVQVRSKTVESLTGNDSSEIAEIQPINRSVQCQWANRYLEQQGSGYRVWLQCSVSKKTVDAQKIQANQSDSVLEANATLPSFRRAIGIATSLPPAELFVIGGERGERVIHATKNPSNLELREGDQWVIAK